MLDLDQANLRNIHLHLIRLLLHCRHTFPLALPYPEYGYTQHAH